MLFKQHLGINFCPSRIGHWGYFQLSCPSHPALTELSAMCRSGHGAGEAVPVSCELCHTLSVAEMALTHHPCVPPEPLSCTSHPLVPQQLSHAPDCLQCVGPYSSLSAAFPPPT